MASLLERYRDTLRLAHLAAMGRRHNEALRAYRDAAVQAPDRAAPRIGIARMELALGRPVAAIAACDLALAADPGSVEAQAVRALAVASLTPDPVLFTDVGRPVWSRAHVPDDDPAVGGIVARWEAALDAQDASTLLEIAVELGRAERPDAAFTALHDALGVAPADSRVYQIAAWLEGRRGRWPQARRLDRALDRYLQTIDDPDALERMTADAVAAGDVAGLVEVIERHGRQRRPRSALETALSALRIAPTSVDVHLAIARVHLGLGMRQRAIDDLEQLARYLEIAEDRDGQARLAAFVDRELQYRQAGPEGS